MQFGWTEILLIVALVFLLFGAKRIPEIAQSFGKGVREFKKGLNGETDNDAENQKSKPNEPK